MTKQIQITLPDGSVRKYDQGITGLQIAASISEGLARNVLAAKINGQVWDATRPITEDSSLQLLTWNDTEGKSTFWHSSAHLRAEALEALYPGVKLGIGPSIDTGFYYDVDFGDHKLEGDELEKIENKMLELGRLKSDYIRKEISKKGAVGYFQQKGDEY